MLFLDARRFKEGDTAQRLRAGTIVELQEWKKETGERGRTRMDGEMRRECVCVCVVHVGVKLRESGTREGIERSIGYRRVTKWNGHRNKGLNVCGETSPGSECSPGSWPMLSPH